MTAQTYDVMHVLANHAGVWLTKTCATCDARLVGWNCACLDCMLVLCGVCWPAHVSDSHHGVDPCLTRGDRGIVDDDGFLLICKSVKQP